MLSTANYSLSFGYLYLLPCSSEIGYTTRNSQKQIPSHPKDSPAKPEEKKPSASRDEMPTAELLRQFRRRLVTEEYLPESVEHQPNRIPCPRLDGFPVKPDPTDHTAEFPE